MSKNVKTRNAVSSDTREVHEPDKLISILQWQTLSRSRTVYSMHFWERAQCLAPATYRIRLLHVSLSQQFTDPLQRCHLAKMTHHQPANWQTCQDREGC